MRLKEFDGYLPIELRLRKQYYDKDAVALNAARYAILLSLRTMDRGVVNILHYLCSSVKETLILGGIKVKEYNIDETLIPENIEDEKEPIVFVNYFGVMARSEVKRFIKSYKNVIVDNTQSFFVNLSKTLITFIHIENFWAFRLVLIS